jgi:hypothetical protein
MNPLTPSQKSSLRAHLGLLAGHASMCWNPRPSTQEFDSSEAIKAVDSAYDDIVRILTTNDETESDITVENNDFTKELEHLINKHNKEAASNTPDFILADYLTRCLMAYNRAVFRRDRWSGKSLDALATGEPLEIGVECGWPESSSPTTNVR